MVSTGWYDESVRCPHCDYEGMHCDGEEPEQYWCDCGHGWTAEQVNEYMENKERE